MKGLEEQKDAFELGRLFERRETRDQLLAMIPMMDDRQRLQLMVAWVNELSDNLGMPILVTIQETYVVIE